MSIISMIDLREQLAQEFSKSSNGESTPSVANACANLAGKMMSSLKIEIEYCKMRGEKPEIKFFKQGE